MRRVLFISLTGMVVGGCADGDMIRPPTDPSRVTSASSSSNAATATSRLALAGILDDAIDRLVPALGPRGVALGAPLRQLRSGGPADIALVDATRRQLAALAASLPPESTPDAEALEIALVALRDGASK